MSGIVDINRRKMYMHHKKVDLAAACMHTEPTSEDNDSEANVYDNPLEGWWFDDARFCGVSLVCTSHILWCMV